VARSHLGRASFKIVRIVLSLRLRASAFNPYLSRNAEAQGRREIESIEFAILVRVYKEFLAAS
jgi:hypothetical protein